MATYTITTITKQVGILGMQKKQVEQRVMLKDGEIYTNIPKGATAEDESKMIAAMNLPDATPDELEQYE